MDLVGLQHDDEAAGVDGLHGVLDLVELLVGAGSLQAASPSSVTIMASIEDEKPNIILLMTADTIKLNMIP